eukprot:1754324-Pyramimonas_sp.AAC.1
MEPVGFLNIPIPLLTRATAAAAVTLMTTMPCMIRSGLRGRLELQSETLSESSAKPAPALGLILG